MIKILFSIKKQNDEDLMWSYPINTFRCLSFFKNHDINLDFDFINDKNQNNYDLVFTDSRFLTKKLLDSQEKPLVVYDQTDFSSCYNGNYGNIRDFLCHDKVKSVLKNSMYDNLEFHNYDTYEGTLHGKICLDLAIKNSEKNISCLADCQKHQNINKSAFGKMSVLSHYLWSDIVDKSLIPNISHDTYQNLHLRPVDLILIGSGSHYWCWHVRWHREKAIDAIKKLPNEIIKCLGLSEDKNIAKYRKSVVWPMPPQYFSLCCKSKIVLSPWGYGEVSTRDYEAVLCGNVIIKPRLSVNGLGIKTYPEDLYEGESIVFCEPDFSDLEAKAYEILNNYDKYAQAAIIKAKKFCEIYKTNSAFDNLLFILKKLLTDKKVKYF